VVVADGDAVNAGDPLVVIIAMKMEYVIKAPTTGVIEKVMFRVGDNVAKNALLVKMQSEAASEDAAAADDSD